MCKFGFFVWNWVSLSVDFPKNSCKVIEVKSQTSTWFGPDWWLTSWKVGGSPCRYLSPTYQLCWPLIVGLERFISSLLGDFSSAVCGVTQLYVGCVLTLILAAGAFNLVSASLASSSSSNGSSPFSSVSMEVGTALACFHCGCDEYCKYVRGVDLVIQLVVL